MTREQFKKILRDNGVAYDKNIEKEEVEGFVNDGCAEYAEKLYDDLFKLTLFGVQYGFNKCGDEIYDLTKLLSSLIAGISRKEVNLARTEEKRLQIMKRANYLRKEINMDMVYQLTANLEDCVRAADSISIIRKDNASLCARLSESKEVLLKIKEALSNVADGTSKSAAEYQVKIFDALMTWRDAVSRYNCYTDTVEGLRDALKQAEEWGKLTATVRHGAKRNVDYYEYREDFDEINYIISAAKYAERTDGMREHLNDFRNQTAQIYGADTLKKELEKTQSDYLAERDRLNNRLEEIKRETDEILAKFQNGETDAVTADMKVSDLDGEAEDVKEELANAKEDFDYETEDIRAQIKDAQDGSRIREKIAGNFEKFVNRIEAYRNTDPAMFVMLCGRIDFNGVYDTLSGRLTDKQIDEVYVTVETVIRETEEDIKRQRKSLTGLNAINDKVRERRRQEERILAEQENARRERLKGQRQTSVRNSSGVDAEAEARARLMARLSGTPQPAEKNTETKNVVTGINNDDK